MFLRVNIWVFFALLLVGCFSDSYDTCDMLALDNTRAHLVLTLVMPNDDASSSAATRSSVYEADGYEAGVDYENEVNIDGGDYRIYFFSYAADDSKGGTLLAKFEPTSVTSASVNGVTHYTLTGDVPAELNDVSNFRVVMLANWGAYPSTTLGVTTIDDLCEGTNTTYDASNKFSIDANNLIPFFGVQEYTDVTFTVGSTTTLSTPVSLLRAVAKVEVILTDESDYDAFENVEIVNYNSQGYCAPWGVYTAADYDTTGQKNPNTSDWPDEWVSSLHLPNNANDVGSKSQAFTYVSGTTLDTWRIYVPEYDNTSEDYSYISVTIDGTPYEIYFAEYLDGATDNDDLSNRYNIKRNNLYRYYITIISEDREEKEVTIIIRVWVDKWENCFDNEYIFGTDEE